MPARASLLIALRQLRRRLRLIAACDGAVRGAALGLGALAVTLAVARRQGGIVFPIVAVAIVAAGALVGAAALALRPIPLGRCARALDAALDGQDRVLSAFSLMGAPASPMVVAVIADAVGRVRALAPAAVTPLRRPRGLVGLALAAAPVVVLALLPGRAPAALPVAARARPDGAHAADRLRVQPSRLGAEREEAKRAAERAADLGDEQLATLARSLEAAVRALSDGTLARGEALDRLAALAAAAARAAEEAESARSGLRAAGSALEQTPSTRAAGSALGAQDAAATERALAELAARAGEAGGGERNQIARALDAAAARAGSGGGSDAAGTGAPGESQRRLESEQSSATGDGPGAAGGDRGDRQLERLSRDLSEAAAACRENPEACRRHISKRAGDLPRMQREGLSAEARRQLANAARMLRERLRRGDLDDRGRDRVAERRQLRPGKGHDKSPGSRREPGHGSGSSGALGLGDGDPNGEAGDPDDSMSLDIEGEEDLAIEDGDAASGAGAEGTARAADGDGQAPAAAGQSGGVGNQPGAEPLGAARADGRARGHEREARVRGGAGPNRAQVISAAAERGFAREEYGRVFSDYQSVVEEALAAGAVPDGRRYVVRRYFQIIRPRAPRRSR